MAAILTWLSGKKTYITAGLILVLTVLVSIHIIAIPDWVWVGLSALGFGFVKASIPDVSSIQLTGIAQQVFATKWGKYIVPVLYGIAAGLMALGIPIPEIVWTGLAGLGFTSIRANIAVAKLVASTK
jgi:hypothetical protein